MSLQAAAKPCKLYWNKELIAAVERVNRDRPQQRCAGLLALPQGCFGDSFMARPFARLSKVSLIKWFIGEVSEHHCW